VIVDWALEDVAETGGKARPAVPQNDNVSAATLLKALQALGLFPPVEKQKTSPAKTPVSALDRFQHGNFPVVNGGADVEETCRQNSASDLDKAAS